jgi:holo-[acyl-carrier protein] synthase
VSDGTVLGTGIDLVENDRMQDMMQRWGAKFLNRVFLSAEQTYCNAKAFPCRHYAGRFAVKEAVSKAFGTGLGPSIGWLDIEVVRDEASGAPSVRLDDKGLKLADARGVKSVLVSLSHTKKYAVAQALLIGG